MPRLRRHGLRPERDHDDAARRLRVPDLRRHRPRTENLTMERLMSRRDRGMATWGVHDDLQYIAIITRMGRNRWRVEEYRTDIAAWFRTKSQAFHYANIIQ